MNTVMKCIEAFVKYLLLVSTLALLTACPYPVYKTLRPNAKVIVTDRQQQPIAAATVVLITRVHPTPDRLYDAKLTNAQGVAQFLAKREVQVETTMLHGSLEYDWGWCVEKPGYQTEHLSHGDTELQVILSAGQSTPCVSEQK